MNTTALMFLVLAGSPAPTPPVDGDVITPPKVQALAPLSEDQYPSDTFMVGISGPFAKKIYSFYVKSPFPTYDMTHTLSRSEYLRPENSNIVCVRRIAKFGPEQFRCNILFHPTADQGTTVVTPPATYVLAPVFENGLLKTVQLNLTVTKNGVTTRHKHVAPDCSHLRVGDFAWEHRVCSYTVDSDDVSHILFKDDINPQGVAVGWGVAPETQNE